MIEGLFVRTKKQPYTWSCVVQRQGSKHAAAFHRLWALREEMVGKHRVRIIQTNKVKLTEDERLALKEQAKEQLTAPLKNIVMAPPGKLPTVYTLVFCETADTSSKGTADVMATSYDEARDKLTSEWLEAGIEITVTGTKQQRDTK